MPEPAMLDYFYGDEAEQYTFYRIPKVLFTDPAYRRISSDAKILYGLMLDRMGLSVRNGWLDDCQRVFIYFTLEDALEYLCCGHTKAVSLFAELDKGGLIERKKQGQGKPTKIYVKNFVRKAEVLTSEKRKSKVPQTGSQDFQKTYSNNTDINNTELNDTDPSIYPDRGLPEDRPPAAADTMDTMGAYREIIKENIEYSHRFARFCIFLTSFVTVFLPSIRTGLTSAGSSCAAAVSLSSAGMRSTKRSRMILLWHSVWGLPPLLWRVS